MQGKAVTQLKGEAGAKNEILDLRLECLYTGVSESCPTSGDNFSQDIIRNKKSSI
jgi:hypothetical protein